MKIQEYDYSNAFGISSQQEPANTIVCKKRWDESLRVSRRLLTCCSIIVLHDASLFTLHTNANYCLALIGSTLRDYGCERRF